MEVQKSKLKRDRRPSPEMEEGYERSGIKMRELKSLLDDKGPLEFGEKEKSQVTEDHAMAADVSVRVDPKSASEQLDLNSEPCDNSKLVCDNRPRLDENLHEEGSPVNRKTHCENNSRSSRGIDLDLNEEDVASSVNTNPFHPYKDLDRLKSRDVSECASSTGPLEKKDKDPLRIWKEMKQNGFLSSSASSSSHGGIPMPKQRGRKNKNDLLLKKRLELAKKEQADRFAKLAAPSGLLNELNPGIINHVRNKKQVHSIIEALVKSERSKDVNKEAGNRKEIGSYDLGMNWQKKWHRMAYNKHLTCTSDDEDEDGGTAMVQKLYNTSLTSLSNLFSQDDTMASRPSSSLTKASEMPISKNGSTNLSSVTSLSVKAATIASQWLELLHQDIKGRLTALRRSKRRVQAVISTELPFLMSKELSFNQENDPSVAENSAGSHCTAFDMHRLKWSALFDQMDKALSQEEKQLEIWLNQVREMQLHCEHGLQNENYNAAYGSLNLGPADNDSRSGKADTSERELAVKAAAASIYSTCNFLLSKGDVSCF